MLEDPRNHKDCLRDPALLPFLLLTNSQEATSLPKREMTFGGKNITFPNK